MINYKCTAIVLSLNSFYLLPFGYRFFKHTFLCNLQVKILCNIEKKGYRAIPISWMVEDESCMNLGSSVHTQLLKYAIGGNCSTELSSSVLFDLIGQNVLSRAFMLFSSTKARLHFHI